MKKKVAISCGDINGVGLEILLKSHHLLTPKIEPLYCVHYELLQIASSLLQIPLAISPSNCLPPSLPIPTITPKQITQESGRYSYESFILGCELCDTLQTHALCTLPIHKKAWNLAGVQELGHTQVLSKRYGKSSIMMLGCEEMFVALYSDHIPLKQVSQEISVSKILDFLLRLYQSTQENKYCVMGINPHCGDDGIIGTEDEIIKEAILKANEKLGKPIFEGPIPSDCAFIPPLREKYKIWVAMYHDIGLATLKALYFEESINVSLDIPILRTSVDHGVAFDIAYTHTASNLSYLNAIDFIIKNG